MNGSDSFPPHTPRRNKELYSESNFAPATIESEFFAAQVNLPKA